MPIYITLMKFTSQGMTGIPAWRDRVEEAEQAIEARGGRLVDAYVTLGRYDVVEIFEEPWLIPGTGLTRPSTAVTVEAVRPTQDGRKPVLETWTSTPAISARRRPK